MSNRSDINIEGGDGCGIFIGAIIVSVCIGHIWGTVYGWLLFGGIILFDSMISSVINLIQGRYYTGRQK